MDSDLCTRTCLSQLHEANNQSLCFHLCVKPKVLCANGKFFSYMYVQRTMKFFIIQPSCVSLKGPFVQELINDYFTQVVVQLIICQRQCTISQMPNCCKKNPLTCNSYCRYRKVNQKQLAKYASYLFILPVVFLHYSSTKDSSGKRFLIFVHGYCS